LKVPFFSSIILTLIFFNEPRIDQANTFNYHPIESKIELNES